MRGVDHVSFDLETTGICIDTDDIVCGATRKCVNGTVVVKLWHSNYADRMDEPSLHELARYLLQAHLEGLPIVTFNGAKFDFAILGRHLKGPLKDQIQSLVWKHVDIMFAFACQHGYFASMDSFAKGCELAPKTWNGLEAAEAWQENKPGDRAKVVAYCREDVRCLSDLYVHIVTTKSAKRVTKSNSIQNVHFGELKTVEHAATQYLVYPPDCSWMKEPFDVTDGLSWLLL